MANTLTNLLPSAYEALDVVSRELSGMIPAVMMVPSLERVSTGQTIYVPAAPANAAGFDVTPAMAVPAAADQTIGNTSITRVVAQHPFTAELVNCTAHLDGTDLAEDTKSLSGG